MPNEDKIEALIKATQDPVVQATLLVLLNIDKALDSNTRATERIAAGISTLTTTLNTHVVDEEKLLSSMRGGQKVGAYLMTFLLGISVWVAVSAINKNDAQDSTIVELRTVQHSVLQRVLLLEDLMRKHDRIK